jgi:hypothetical protein
MNAARTEQPIEPPEDDAARDNDDTADNVRRVAIEIVTGMQRTIDELRADMRRDNWRRLVESQNAAPAPKLWMGLKAAARDVDWPYQNVLKLCVDQVIVAEKRGGRWFCEMNNLRAHISAQRGK